MTTNRLSEPKAGKVTVDILQELADSLNGEWWVKGMRRHYFVKREANPNFDAGSDDPKKREFVHSLAWNG